MCLFLEKVVDKIEFVDDKNVIDIGAGLVS